MTYAVVTLLLALIGLALIDVTQRRDPVRRIYPLVGRLPSLLRRLARVLRVALTTTGPFTADDIDEIRGRARTGTAITSFGTTTRPGASPGYRGVAVSLLPAKEVSIEATTIGGSVGSRTISVPVLNFGALGYGPVNERVIQAFGLAARDVGCLLNTGEDGLTTFHLNSGARLIWGSPDDDVGHAAAFVAVRS